MGQQIILQPNGKFAVWSSVVDDFVLYDAMPAEILDMWVAIYRRDMERTIARTVIQLRAGEKPYYQFTKTWDEALARRRRVHGADAEPLALDPP